MKNLSKKVLVLALVLILALSICMLVACDKTPGGGDEAAKVVRISTTTSVNDSGLMEYLRPYFEADTGYKWEISSAGTGAAIASATYGNADVILVHSKKSEEEFVAGGYSYKVSGYNSERVSFMHNYFVLVGPSSDPAGVSAVKATNPTDGVKAGFAAIASAEAKFISRGDKSGTHNKEVTLWPSNLGIATADGKPASPVPSLSALEEDVYRIAVTFDTGTTFTQKVGRVLGSANSPHVGDVAFRNAASTRWPRLTGSTAVLPIPAGAQSISVNGGTPVDTGLGGARGWYLFGPVATGEYDVALATNAGGLEGTIISCALGTVLMLQ